MTDNMKDSCKSCKKHHEHVYWEHNDTGRVRFCKTMIGDFSLHMSIPEKFISRLWENLLDIIELKGPSGNSWSVRLVESAESYFFQNGWKKFVEAHQVEENDIMFFEYEGRSRFSVLIFDSSGCEKESSYFSKPDQSEKQQASEEGSLKILEPSLQATRDGSNCSSYSSPNYGNILEESSPSSNYQRGESSCSKRKTKKRRQTVTPKVEISEAGLLGNQYDNRSSSRRPATEAERKAARNLAVSKLAEIKRPSFFSVLKRYNVRYQFQLLIPPEFVKEFLPQKSQEIILRVDPCARKEWKVKYCVGETAARFIGKWRNFVRDNDLEEGDVCVFELSKSKKKTIMTVHIFRAGSKEELSTSA